MQNHRSQNAELLPWFVNKTLAAHEQQQIETALGRDLVLRRELRHTQMLAETIANAQPLEINARHSLSRLHTKIRRQTGYDTLWLRLGLALRVPRPALRAGFAGALVLAAAGLLWVAGTVETRHYETLTNPAPTQYNSTVLRVVFAEGLNAARIREVTAELEGHIVDGPGRVGVYTVTLADDSDAQVLLSRWRRSDQVQFAEIVAPPN